MISTEDQDGESKQPALQTKAQTGSEVSSRHRAVGPMPPSPQRLEEAEDIHLYTRVRIVDVDFRFQQLASSSSTKKSPSPSKSPSKRPITITSQDLEDMDRFARDLAETYQLSETECRDLLNDLRDARSALRDDHIERLDTRSDQVPGENTTVQHWESSTETHFGFPPWHEELPGCLWPKLPEKEIQCRDSVSRFSMKTSLDPTYYKCLDCYSTSRYKHSDICCDLSYIGEAFRLPMEYYLRTSKKSSTY
jgi:hypothetical protein